MKHHNIDSEERKKIHSIIPVLRSSTSSSSIITLFLFGYLVRVSLSQSPIHGMYRDRREDNSRDEVASQECPLPKSHVWCSCYQFDDGVFIECPATGLVSIRTTLNAIHSPIKSFTIYQLDKNVTILPEDLFTNTSIEHLQMSYTSIENITENTFNGLEGKLKTLAVANSRLQEVPGLSSLKVLESLDLDSNEILEVESYSFYGLGLLSLNLQGNKISSLLEYSFGGLENTLEELNLINNRLQYFPLSALRRLRKLGTLKLVGNEITDIPDDGFTRFTALQNLDLSSNRMTELDDRSFINMPKLVSLSLYANKLTAIDDRVFVYLTELETLDLSHNTLRTLNGDVFRALHKLRTVDLSHNHLHYIEFGTFHSLPNLRELFLSHNNLLRISNTTFWNSTQIAVIFLANNAISDIEFGSFYSLPHLFQLHLSFNQIKEAHLNLFKYNHELRSLSLDNNLIANIQPGTFQELVELRDLRLQKNLLKKIRKGVFYSFPNLQELHLQNNRIELIENESLQSLVNLQYLNIQGNKLIEIEESLSKYPSSLRYLQLNNNFIANVHNESLKGQNQLEILWLNYNKLQKISRLVFSDLNQVQKIYLDHNEISSIESGSFLALKHLTYLNLEFNNLNHLSKAMFSGPENLFELYLSHNHIMDIEPGSFESMKNLKILHLSHNQLYFLRKYMFSNGQVGLPIEELDLSNIMAEEIEPDTFSSLESLVKLDISENNLNEGKIDLLFSLRIKHLNLSGNNLTGDLDEDIFHSLSSVEHLDLTRTGFNSMTSGKTLVGLKSVQILELSNNEISELPNPVYLRTLSTIKELYLDNNQLNHVPGTDVLGVMSSMEVLSLSGNSIKQVVKGAFRNNTNIKKLSLSRNNLSVLDPHSFMNLTELESLDLSENVIRYISNQVFDKLDSLIEINLDNNWFQFIPNNFIRSSIPRLKSLTLNGNPILRIREDLSITGGFPSLERLSISRSSNLSIIASNDFFGFPNLKSLILRTNHISKISPGSFRTNSKLSSLDLAENKLEILPEERLSGLGNLKLLNLTRNHLLEMPFFSDDLQQLEHLDLSFNRLTRVDTFGHLSSSVKSIFLHNNIVGWIAIIAFQNLSSLQVLDLRSNFLTHLEDDLFDPIEASIEKLLLAGNPFYCDCRLFGSWEWIQDHSKLLKSNERDEGMTCSQPEKLRDHFVLSLHPVDFCPVPLISVMEVLKLDAEKMTLKWEVQNDTLVGGFTLDYHLTSDRLPNYTNKNMESFKRHKEIDRLKPETLYTVCVQANGKYLRSDHKPKPYVVDHQKNYGEYITSNRKCLQVRTLAQSEKTKMFLSTFGIIVSGCVCALVITSIFILLTAIKFRNKRRQPVKNDVPEEYITYRHFSLPSSENVYS